jgi:RHS repeat-associated protein
VAAKYTYATYTLRGEPAAQWGAATNPVSFGYNDYGERTSLTTYRSDTGLTGTTWPASPPPGDTTTWEFDGPSGLLKKKTDALTRYVQYDYNSRGQVRNRYWARPVQSTPLSFRVTATYGYDPKTGEPTSIIYNDNGVTPSVTTTYTRLGQASTVTDHTGTRSFAYDSSAPWRLATTTLPAFYQGNVFTSLYETATSSSTGTVKGSGRGFQLGTVATPAAVLQQTYVFNNLGRVTGITAARTNGAATQAFDYTYLTGSRLLQSVAATGTAFTTTRTYETSRDLLINIKGQWSTTTATEFAYTHDDLARRDTAAQSGTAFDDYGTTTRQRYTYNDRGELTAANGYLSAEAPANKLPGRQFEFGYDAAGNRLSVNHTGDAAKADTFTPNALNQIASRDNKAVSVSGSAAYDTLIAVDNQLATRKDRFWQIDLPIATNAPAAARLSTAVAAKVGAGTGGADVAQIDRRPLFFPPAAETLTYDEDGNLITDGRWTYTWDAENQLVAMESFSWTSIPNIQPRLRLEFRYDAVGRRVQKTVLNEGGTPGSWILASETRYLYDGWNLIAEFGWNAATSIYALNTSYVWGLDLNGSLTESGGVGALLQITDHTTGTTYFPTYDGNGNVVTLLNAASGVIAASYEYNAFGELLRATGAYAKANPFRFSTKFTDNESGLIYYGYRFYDPRNGRFINRDPIGEADGYNIYRFSENDGVNNVDVLGLYIDFVYLTTGSGSSAGYNLGAAAANNGVTFTTGGGGSSGIPVVIGGPSLSGNRPGSSRPRNSGSGSTSQAVPSLTPAQRDSIILLTNAAYLEQSASNWSEIRPYDEPGFWDTGGAVALMRGMRDRGLGMITMMAHPINTYREFRTIREPLTRYGSSVDNFLISVRTDLKSPYGRGGLLMDVVAAKGLNSAQAVIGESVSAFRTGLASESRLALSGPRTGSSLADVSKSVFKTRQLPGNYITKAEAEALGWRPKAGNLDTIAPGKSIGGDIFENRRGILPSSPGRVWYEADLNYTGGYRGSERLLYSNDGQIFYSGDHYKTFQQIGSK